MTEKDESPTKEEKKEELLNHDESFKHFNHFVQQLDTQQSLVNPTMNIINFYKVLFNEVSNINLDMNGVLDLYQNKTRELEPSNKYDFS